MVVAILYVDAPSSARWEPDSALPLAGLAALIAAGRGQRAANPDAMAVRQLWLAADRLHRSGISHHRMGRSRSDWFVNRTGWGIAAV